MLVVAVTLTAKPGNETQLVEGVRKLVNEARGRPGLRYTKIARRIEQGRTRILIFGEYESSGDMARYAEYDQVASAPLEPFIESAEGGMWEAIDIDFDGDSGQPIFDELQQPLGFAVSG